MAVLLPINLAATLLLTGIAWSLQFVQLPMLRPEDATMHRRLNTRLVILPMILEAATTIWLAIDNRSVPILAATAFWLGVAIATAGYTRAHSLEKLDQLRYWNLARALCWTARSILLSMCVIALDVAKSAPFA